MTTQELREEMRWNVGVTEFENLHMVLVEIAVQLMGIRQNLQQFGPVSAPTEKR